ncbi:MAG: hypothetical protein WBA45_09350 [Microthrixaceae bacterium]
MDQTKAPGEGPADREFTAPGAVGDEVSREDESGFPEFEFEAEGSESDGSQPENWIEGPAETARRELIERIISWAIVGACCLFVFTTLNPRLILQNSVPTGGDMGAHVWGPRFLADHLIPQFRVSGWSMDWYAGFPTYVFYMVVPSLMILWLSAGPSLWLTPVLLAIVAGIVWALRPRLTAPWQRWVLWVGTVIISVLAIPIPYNVAFKIVAVSGLVTLPIAAYQLARATRAPFPVAPIAAVATLGFSYDKGFTILGGNGASTMAGEFAFSVSLTFALLYLAVVFRGMRTGRSRALGAVLLAMTILCHLIPAIFAGIATLGVIVFLRRDDRDDREPWWDANAVGRIAAGLIVAIVLLSLFSGTDLPGAGVLNSLPLASILVPSQSMFPALATLAAIAFFTGFEPRIPDRLRRLSGLVPTVAATIVIAGVIWKFGTWWAFALGLVALVILYMAGIDTKLLRWIAIVGPVGGFLTGFWALPFLANSTYMNDMGWEKYTRYTDYLLAVPELDLGGMPYRNVIFGLAAVGVLLSLVYKVRFGWFLSLLVVVFAWIFRYFPQYRLWNARLLPFYYLALYLLAGLAAALIIRTLAVVVSDLSRAPKAQLAAMATGAVVVTLVVMTVFLGSFKALPGGSLVPDPKDPTVSVYRWAGINFPLGIVNDWSRWNFSGLEGKPAYPEFRGVMDMMGQVGDDHGCGRAMWEFDSDTNRYGTTMALMLLPYFTDSCIGSMEGLYFEASSTTPFHFLTQSEVSTAPSRAQRELPYGPFNIDEGIEHMRLLGVRYYMATSEQAITAAEGNAQLRKIDDKTFTYMDGAEKKSHRWAVFQISDSELVEGLTNDPAVVADIDDHIDGWVYAKKRLAPNDTQAAAGTPGFKLPGPATDWFMDPSRWDIFLASSGPSNWPRTTVAKTPDLKSTRRPNPEVKVSDLKITSDSVSFDVDKVGVPVLVKVSYFPNWKVEGATGPYRVTPNFMVVVPTSNHVELNYGYSRVELLGWLMTALGVVAVVGLALWDHRRELEDPPTTSDQDPVEPEPHDPDQGGSDPETDLADTRTEPLLSR